ncbi:MAG: biotin transporter BioY [Oscillospiraceae bacterium]|jgi:biotin transport system substrate-specific component|nr:biotin transporter BioY [Oscillospiraceae bacterium]
MNVKTKDLTKSGLCVAILVVLAQISFYIGVIPITGAVLGILLMGGILQPPFALMSSLAYICLGVFNLPVFAGFKGGYGVILGVTGGYLLAYPIMAFSIALIIKKIGNRSIFTLLISFTSGILILYILGTAWFMLIGGYSLSTALTLCVYPFIPAELIKTVCAVGIIKGLIKVRIV